MQLLNANTYLEYINNYTQVMVSSSYNIWTMRIGSSIEILIDQIIVGVWWYHILRGSQTAALVDEAEQHISSMRTML